MFFFTLCSRFSFLPPSLSTALELFALMVRHLPNTSKENKRSGEGNNIGRRCTTHREGSAVKRKIGERCSCTKHFFFLQQRATLSLSVVSLHPLLSFIRFIQILSLSFPALCVILLLHIGISTVPAFLFFFLLVLTFNTLHSSAADIFAYNFVNCHFRKQQQQNNEESST